mgnify:CR=1 FL=1
MFKKSPIQTAVLLAVGALTVLPALAQDSTQRIEITGSAIRRVDAETAVPVTIIKAEDLKAQGVTTIEQALQSITSVQTTVGTSQTVGAGYGGAAFADMRGPGQKWHADLGGLWLAPHSCRRWNRPLSDQTRHNLHCLRV